ncbi:MAG: TlyA family RNA methyltransferase [Synergistaceae bacterium]|jgi:23S rRNA (cytidine1920-2'-O)/16S rRNA (cytidine1409-2'-O)-methyltransferase|nr:TlyA family RNA methyltransferase [Synergistaceae bacterium]
MASRPPERLDKLLVSRGLASSRAEAADFIKNGRVKVLGIKRVKPSSMFAHEASIEMDGDEYAEKRWVGRGAYKLLRALEEWNVDPKGCDCADIGASTGGFTQVLLDSGAARVAAVDVGYGQLAWKLRNDPRVKVMDRINARYVTAEDIGWRSGIVTVDASFISLRTLLPCVKELARDDGIIITLVKPQFEVGRAKIGKGVIRDPSLHAEVMEGLSEFAETECGLVFKGAVYSPLKGSSGNIEFIFLLTRAGNELSARRAFDFSELARSAGFSLR